ncbi:MAG: CPBP family intramembrane metalloprotease, partial [Bdellovibrionales bacterium]|nr:CPBP family intramembrane metalloprotease [Bdellovibrionales bacterium]
LAVKNLKLAWVGTSVLFSYSHFHAFWFIAPDIKAFIYYQTVYTLGLGLACGYAVYKHKSLGGAMLIHGLFNLGFYVGALS